MEERASWETITIHFAGKPLRVPSGISVKEALELSGYPISPFPKGDRIFVPCEVGSVSNNRKGRDGADPFKKFQYLLNVLFSGYRKYLDLIFIYLPSMMISTGNLGFLKPTSIVDK